jgi:hypothetical protein
MVIRSKKLFKQESELVSGRTKMTKVLGSGVDALRSFVEKCLASGGVPIIRTKYGGRRFPENKVVVACWGKGKEVPGGTIENVPTDIIEQAEKQVGDWKWLAARLGIRA